jgi:hypothetical protein
MTVVLVVVVVVVVVEHIVVVMEDVRIVPVGSVGSVADNSFALTKQQCLHFHETSVGTEQIEHSKGSQVEGHSVVYWMLPHEDYIPYYENTVDSDTEIVVIVVEDTYCTRAAVVLEDCSFCY